MKPLSSADESLLCFCEERRVQQVTRLDVILLGAIFGVHHSVETITSFLHSSATSATPVAFKNVFGADQLTLYGSSEADIADLGPRAARQTCF